MRNYNALLHQFAIGQYNAEFRYTHDEIKLTINKNKTGCFRIQFHDYEHMQKIMEKLGYQEKAE